jgi:hypothetical protein
MNTLSPFASPFDVPRGTNPAPVWGPNWMQDLLANRAQDQRAQMRPGVVAAAAPAPAPTFGTDPFSQLLRKNALFQGTAGVRTDAWGTPITAPSAPNPWTPNAAPAGQQDPFGGGGMGSGSMGGPSAMNGKQADGHWPIGPAGQIAPTSKFPGLDAWRQMNPFSGVPATDNAPLSTAASFGGGNPWNPHAGEAPLSNAPAPAGAASTAASFGGGNPWNPHAGEAPLSNAPAPAGALSTPYSFGALTTPDTFKGGVPWPPPAAADATAGADVSFWHGGQTPPSKIVVGDKRPGSRAKGPLPEVMVPHDPWMPAKVVGKRGPQVITPPKGGATIVPNKKNLPHFWTGGDTDADSTFPPTPNVDQDLMALSWGAKAPTPGLTDWGDGNKTLSTPFGNGVITTLPQFKLAAPTGGDEKGNIDWGALMAKSKQPAPDFASQVFGANKGQANVPYQADPLAGTPWGQSSGNAPLDATAAVKGFRNAFSGLQAAGVQGPTDADKYMAARAQSFADVGANPFSIAPAPVLDPWNTPPGTIPTPPRGSWGEVLPTLSPGLPTSPVNSIPNPLGLTGPSLQEWYRTHGTNTIAGRGALMEGDVARAQAGIAFKRELDLKDHENQNALGIAKYNQGAKDNRQQVSLDAKAANGKGAPVHFTPEEIAMHRAGNAKLTLDPTRGDTAVYEPTKQGAPSKSMALHFVSQPDGGVRAFNPMTGEEIKPEALPEEEKPGYIDQLRTFVSGLHPAVKALLNPALPLLSPSGTPLAPAAASARSSTDASSALDRFHQQFGGKKSSHG